MTPRRRASFAALVGLALAGAPTVASAQTDPRYFNQIRAELQAMGFSAQCAAPSAQVGSCRFRTTAQAATNTPTAQPGTASAPSGRQFVVALEYSDETDTVYVYIDRYATVRADAATAPAVFRRFAEMNWEMLVGKFEWSPQTGEVRLGAVLNTDSNFDRRAFRGVVRAVVRLADRYAEELSRIAGSPVGEAAAAPTSGALTPVPPPSPNPAAAR